MYTIEVKGFLKQVKIGFWLIKNKFSASQGESDGNSQGKG